MNIQGYFGKGEFSRGDMSLNKRLSEKCLNDEQETEEFGFSLNQKDITQMTIQRFYS